MKKPRTMPFANRVAGVFGILIGGTAYWMTTSFKQFINVPVGPEVFPQIMSVALILFSAILLVQSFFTKDRRRAPTLSLRDKGMQRMLMVLGIVVLMFLLWDTVGFLILSPLVLFLLMTVSGARNWATMIILSLGIAIVVWLLFWKVLVIEIPLGPLNFIY
jgi:putative tricarboxylic transport membrane protein